MSRWLDKDENGVYHEEIACSYECKCLINEVCTNDKSDMCCDFPHAEYCQKCEHVVVEDGIIENT